VGTAGDRPDVSYEMLRLPNGLTVIDPPPVLR
jgi:hypothetical protein